MKRVGFEILIVVVLIVGACSCAHAATSSDPLAMLTALLPILLPAIGTWVIGWLMNSPLAKKLPKPVADFLTHLDPEEIDEFVADAGTSKGRRRIVTNKIAGVLRDIAKRNKVAADDYQIDIWANSVLDHLIVYYKAGVKFASTKIGR